METTFVTDYDYECPKKGCHGRLDYVDGKDDEKQCLNCKSKFKNFTLEAE